MKQKWPCVSIALSSLHNIVTLFHTISICPPFSCPPSPYWDIRHVDHANPPSFPPFHFTHFPSLPVHVEQGRAVAADGIRHVSSPQRPSPFDWYTCVRTIQLRWAMTSAKHFGIFLCLTALGIDTNLVLSYYDFYTLFVYLLRVRNYRRLQQTCGLLSKIILRLTVSIISLLFPPHIFVRVELKHCAKLTVCKSVHHRTIQISHQPDATIFQFIILMFIYSSGAWMFVCCECRVLSGRGLCDELITRQRSPTDCAASLCVI
jgi:hypothetical protein